jgi:hypothetical protein
VLHAGVHAHYCIIKMPRDDIKAAAIRNDHASDRGEALPDQPPFLLIYRLLHRFHIQPQPADRTDKLFPERVRGAARPVRVIIDDHPDVTIKYFHDDLTKLFPLDQVVCRYVCTVILQLDLPSYPGFLYFFPVHGFLVLFKLLVLFIYPKIYKKIFYRQTVYPFVSPWFFIN